MENLEFNYKKRQETINDEVKGINESIKVKQNLIRQLENSQHQYVAMKAFYESKLQSLNEEMMIKERERDLLFTELTQLENKQVHDKRLNEDKRNSMNNNVADSERDNEEFLKFERDKEIENEKKLKLINELKNRDNEIKVLKSKQVELNRLSKIQTKYVEQLSKLQLDIDIMKKQRVELLKSLTNDKKLYLNNLKAKANEIEVLKRQLSKRMNDIDALTKEKLRNESKYKSILKESQILKQKQVTVSNVTSYKPTAVSNQLVNNGNASKSVASKKSGSRLSNLDNKEFLVASEICVDKVTDKNSIDKDNPFNEVDADVDIMNLSQHKNTVLSSSEIRLKKWIDKEIQTVLSIEEKVTSLRQHYEQKNVLKHEKMLIENEIQRLSLQIEQFLESEELHVLKSSDYPSSSDSNGDIGQGSSDDDINSWRDQLNDLQDNLLSIESQLELRTQKILDIQRQLVVSSPGNFINASALSLTL